MYYTEWIHGAWPQTFLELWAPLKQIHHMKSYLKFSIPQVLQRFGNFQDLNPFCAFLIKVEFQSNELIC